MVSKQTVCLRQLAGNRAREVKFGRWLANGKVTPDELIANACARMGELAAGRHVLAIQDSTELNHQAHAGRVSGLGTVGNGSDLGTCFSIPCWLLMRLMAPASGWRTSTTGSGRARRRPTTGNCR